MLYNSSFIYIYIYILYIYGLYSSMAGHAGSVLASLEAWRAKCHDVQHANCDTVLFSDPCEHRTQDSLSEYDVRSAGHPPPPPPPLVLIFIYSSFWSLILTPSDFRCPGKVTVPLKLSFIVCSRLFMCVCVCVCVCSCVSVCHCCSRRRSKHTLRN